MRIPRPFIQDLLSRCDIVELIESYIPLKKKGHNYSACCPFHSEKTPSFTVSPAKQFYHCFGCGVSGNAISFLMDYEKLSFVECIELLAQQHGLEIPQEAGFVKKEDDDLYPLMEEAARFYQQQLRSHQPSINYLKKRGLTGEIAKQFSIGYASSAWDGLLKKLGTTPERIRQLLNAGMIIKKNESNYYDRFRDRIMFPIRDKRGRVIAFGGRILESGEPKYLNSPETIIFHKSQELYGLYQAHQSLKHFTRLLVVEGYMDVIALAQQGIHYAVATLGTATTPEHIKRLFRMTEEVVFCFDGDLAGKNAAWRALEVSLPLLQDGWQLKFLMLPEKEDPDSLIRLEGAQAFESRVIHATSFADFLFQHLSAQIDLTTSEGKSKLSKKAIPLLQKMQPTVFQQLLFEQLSQLIGVDVKTLKKLTGSEMDLPKPLPQKFVVKQKMKRPSLMRLAIALLLQNPEWLNDIPELIHPEQWNLPGSALLTELIQHLRDNPGAHTGTLLEYWRDREEYGLLTQLVGMKVDMPEAGLHQEFRDIIARLDKTYREKTIEALMTKAKENRLEETERQELKVLIETAKEG